jgi:class 3 adenylate cyclase
LISWEGRDPTPLLGGPARVRPSVGQLTWFAFLFGAFFALSSALQYLFLKQQADAVDRAQFADSAAQIAKAVGFRDGVDPARYVRADFESLDYVVVLRDGTVLAIKRTAGHSLRGVLPPVSSPLTPRAVASEPTTATVQSATVRPETWTFITRPLAGGMLVVGLSALEGIADAEARLTRNLDRFGDTLDEAARVNRNRIDNALAWLVIDGSGRLVNGDGRLPLKTDAMLVGSLSGSTREIASDNRVERVDYMPLLDVAGQPAGTIVQFRDVTREKQVLAGQVRFDAAVAGVSFALFLAFATFYSARHEGEKRAIRQAFQHYFSPPVMEAILRAPDRLTLGGQRREVTILFSDIRSFTSLTERLPPHVLTRMLREYFDAMTEEVFATDGVVDKYIGDAIMAFWGAPIEQPDQADRAVTTALAMVARLERLQAKWQDEGLPRLGVGIGVNLGVAAIGNFGSTDRFDYTLVGDAVNVASRIERLTQETGDAIVISETTRRQLTIPVVTRDLGEVALRGKHRPVRLHAVVPAGANTTRIDMANRSGIYGRPAIPGAAHDDPPSDHRPAARRGLRRSGS